MNILYVENHLIFAATVKREFLSEHSITVVPRLAAAREAILRTPFDAFLVDYDLDDGKGDEFVRELRNAGSNAIIIGVSSHDLGNTALKAAGVTAICPKMQFDQIRAVLNKALTSRTE